MVSYIARRKRWWSTLQKLDPDMRLLEAMRASLKCLIYAGGNSS